MENFILCAEKSAISFSFVYEPWNIDIPDISKSLEGHKLSSDIFI